MPASMGSARGSLLPGDCKLKSHPHLHLAMLGLLMLGMGCGEASQREEGVHTAGFGRAALAAEEPTCVIFQRGTSGEVADAKISNRQPGKNFGNDLVAAVSQVNGHQEQVLLRFDTSVIPTQATVTSATLSVWQINSGRPSSLTAHAITGPWAEGSVTWNSFGAAYDTSVAAALDASGPAHPSARILDISGLVSSWVSEPTHNQGVLLAQPEDKALLATSEHPLEELRPRLEICYTELPEGTVPSGTSLLLRVVDSAGNPIPTAAISSQDALFPTDSSGHYLFENLQPGRFFARVDALGYTSATAVVELREGAHVGYQVKLLPLGQRFSFQAEQGDTIEAGQVRVTIPPGSVMDALGQAVMGTVEVSITPLDPSTQLAAMPGPLEGTTASGEPAELESFFMAEVSLWSNGAPVQLAHGASATLEFLLPEAVAGRFQAGDTVPAWWFDLDAGLWREEGMGTVQPSLSHPGRLVWVVQVNHFTWWNCDAPWTDKSCVDVLVVDSDGQPVPDTLVGADGVSYQGASRPSYTGPDGRACVEIKRGQTATVFAGARGGPGSQQALVTGTEEAAVCGGTSCILITFVMAPVICVPGAYAECLYDGPPGTQGQGLCTAGRRRCNLSGTEWSACLGEVTPAAESCESPFDEDCDGAVNEGCSCSAQEGQSCYGGPAGTQGVGICHGGTVGCDLFGNVACQGQQLPRAERCATLEDDDCDGSNECQPVASRLWVPGGTRCARHRDMASAGDGSARVLGRDIGMQWTNMFVTKLDASGSIAWERSLPMPQGWDERELITVDSAGNALVAWRVSTFTGFGAISKLFVAKISPTGEVRWTQEFAGDTESWFGLDGITADVDGGLVIAGSFSGTLRLGGVEHSTGFSWRQFSYIAKFDAATGAPLWSRSKDNSIGSMVVAVDGTGSVLWAGSLNRALTLDEVSLTPLPGGSDAFVVKLDGGTGRASWGQRVGVASVSEGISRLKADGAGNLVMVLNSRVFFETPSNQLAKLDAGGALLWSWSIAQTHYQDLDLDAAGNALLSGNFSGTLDFGGGPRFSPSRARFLAWYDANGGYLMDTYFPGTDSSGTAVDIDAEGHVLLGGSFQGTVDFGTGPVSTSCREEMFVLELDPTP